MEKRTRVVQSATFVRRVKKSIEEYKRFKGLNKISKEERESLKFLAEPMIISSSFERNNREETA